MLVKPSSPAIPLSQVLPRPVKSAVFHVIYGVSVSATRSPTFCAKPTTCPCCGEPRGRRNHRLKVSPGSLGLSLTSLKFRRLSPSNATCPTIAGVLPSLRINRLSAKV